MTIGPQQNKPMPKINRILVTYWHVCAFNKEWSWIQSIERRLPLLYSLYMLTKNFFFFFLNLKKIQNGPSSKCNRDNLPCYIVISKYTFFLEFTITPSNFMVILFGIRQTIASQRQCKDAYMDMQLMHWSALWMKEELFNLLLNFLGNFLCSR